jgi:hypothetical protein
MLLRVKMQVKQLGVEQVDRDNHRSDRRVPFRPQAGERPLLTCVAIKDIAPCPILCPRQTKCSDGPKIAGRCW